MKRVVIESPFAGDVERNVAYLHAAIRDCLARGEAPYASHGFFPGALDDDVPEQRALGIEAGLVWGEVAELVAVYRDLGISAGMRLGIERHTERGIEIEYRSLPGWGLWGYLPPTRQDTPP